MWLLTSLASFAGAVGGHALSRRMIRRGTAVSSFLAFALFAGGVGAYQLSATYGISSEAAAGLLVYMLACELYLFTFTLVAHSVSATLLVSLRNGPRSARDLDLLCSPGWMVHERKAQMLDVGLLAGLQTGYRVTEKGLLLLKSFEKLNRFFFPRPHRR